MKYIYKKVEAFKRLIWDDAFFFLCMNEFLNQLGYRDITKELGRINKRQSQVVRESIGKDAQEVNIRKYIAKMASDFNRKFNAVSKKRYE